MNEQSLSKIINESSVKQEFDSENNSPISSNRIIIDEKISQILGLPEQIVEEESFWPYNVDTLNEILRFKVEQERTRQESIKNEFGTTAVELLKLAKSMNISGDLIPFLFISSGLTSDSLKVKINKLKSEPQEVINEITQKSSEYIPEVSRISSLMSSNAESSLESAATTMSTYASSVGSKRKFSDTQLPSFSETAESIKGTSQSNFVSPTIRSPNRSPSSSHKRGDSDSSDIKLGTGPGTGTGTGTGSAASPVTVPLPLPPTGYAAVNSHQQPQPQSQQHSKPHSPNLQPPLPVQGNVYPVYYTPQPTTSTGKGLGSPYSHKYQPVMYPGPPQPPPNQFQPNYITQPPPGQPYQYFIPSPPNNGQYILQAPSMVRIPTQQTGPNVQPPPPSQQIPPHRQDQQPVPSHQFQSPPESGGGRSVPIFKPAEMFEETSPYKKQKSAGKSQSINFMITTPKNPPARKYNNPHKEK
ncbi:uncharacterized protein RJT21DRAFT_117481 [Scheffersomyces amazonensis]|uniref:uncharacterized protein n=1 Tax=Scheffersomyces amazonensis TaxID=1078765 RepID=UPI00315D36C2